MRARPAVLGILTGLLMALVAPESRAEPAAVAKIVELNKSALAAFAAHDNDKAKEQLLEAVVLGKENNLGMHAAMARTYLHLGVVYVDGFKDSEKGQRYFAMAQKVRADIELTPSLATPTVKAAFDAARGQSGAAKPEPAKPEAAKAEPAKPEVASEPEPLPPKKETKAEARAREKAEKAEAARQAKAEKEAAAAAAKQAKADKETSQILEDARVAKVEEKVTKLQDAMSKSESAAAQREQQLRDERDKLSRELAASRASEKQLKADNDRLQAEERKLQVQLNEKDKQLNAKDIQLAEAKAESKREREGREKAEKQDKENAKRIAEAAKENAKRIAEAADREKKEREAREKLEKDQQAAASKEKERKEREAQDRKEREKLAEGPDLPSNIPQPLTCATTDGVVGADLYMHCVPQGQVKAKSLVFYYRTPGNAHFDAATMNRGKKGWFTAMVPANRVTGKSLQFYVEARGQKDEIAATNGKPTSPNLVVLHATAEEAKKASSENAGLAAAGKSPKGAAKRTQAAKRSKARR
jgi:hypothetical protein